MSRVLVKASPAFGRRRLLKREETVLGQSNLGQSMFGHRVLGQYVCFSGFTICAARKCGGPEVCWPRRVGPKGGAPKGRGHKILRFSVPLPSPFSLFWSLSLGVCSWNFGGVWKRRGSQMCTFGVPGLPCETPAAPKSALTNDHTVQ